MDYHLPLAAPVAASFRDASSCPAARVRVSERRDHWIGLSVTLLAFLIACCAFAQEDEDLFAPGLVARYSNAKGISFDRLDKTPTVNGKDLTPDRRLSAGPFRIEWTGFLLSQANGVYQLHAHFAGKLRVTLDGKLLFEKSSDTPDWHSSSPIELDYDYHPLKIEFEKTGSQSRLGLFWNGPQFQLEPLDGRQFFHERAKTPDDAFERGEVLVRALRCEACHQIGGDVKPLPAPSLEHLSGYLERDWLVQWLTATPQPTEPATTYPARRMPHFVLDATQAEEIASWLFEKSKPVSATGASLRSTSATQSPASETKKGEAGKSKTKKKKDEPEAPVKTPYESGRGLFLTLGCLACHSFGGQGEAGPFDGGDLTTIASKRPGRFFETWLAAPEKLNANHRMPVFDLTDAERKDLTTFLMTLGSRPRSSNAPPKSVSLDRGQKTITSYRCAACHTLPGDVNRSLPTKTALKPNSQWSKSCIGESGQLGQPRFVLTDRDRTAVQAYVSRVAPLPSGESITGHRLVAENNCLHCHQRNDSPGLAARLTQVASQYPEIAPLIPSMTPPPLNSVGDKLQDHALKGAITRQGSVHRPYLLVRMPRFKLGEPELQALLDYFVASDRIPPMENSPGRKTAGITIEPTLLQAVGSRLVTQDGFGCTSCHQVGQVMPVKAPLNARGPDLSMLGQLVRREWFDRWVRNPARIVPRMEMPSVQIPVRGLLHDSLDEQLTAVWDVLNQPGFQPPLPNPIRILRQTGIRPDERALVVTDVLHSSATTYIKPILVGLSNRHNVLFDLETARLMEWSIGDAARQRTEGKSWFWESAGNGILRPGFRTAEISFQKAGTVQVPVVAGQFLTEYDILEHDGSGLRFRYRLQMGDSAHRILVTQSYSPLVEQDRSGFHRTIEVAQVPQGEQVRLAILDEKFFARGKLSANRREWTSAEPVPTKLVVREPTNATLQVDGVIATAPEDGVVKFELDYSTSLPVDRFVVDAPPTPAPQLKPESLQVVPGFSAQRLAFSDDIMPTAIAWRPNGTLVIASLKGQVWQATDTDRDGLADQLTALSDELAAPYGLFATDAYVDVTNKYGLLRLYDDDGDGQVDRTVTLASGWGHTADYHDWAVGLPRDEEGNYYVALPCQQDERSMAAARFRGEFLKLVARQPTVDDPRLFTLQTVSRGHRFPMGIARRRDGEIFVSDNQGNYNPFNEINHIQPAAHYGFINAVEKSSNERAPLTPPAINLPHPWVRSVNGICFLETPDSLRTKSGRSAFGPFEGHLIGCEYDTRRLIRMTLQKVGDLFQGAAYPFSYDQPPEGPPLLGPLVSEVAPDGDLYVGGLRDSGWGGANNVGEVVRLRFQPDQLPCGIAEMRAIRDGFEIEFTSKIDPKLGGELGSYSLASYTRESTPAYGGPDLDHRTEQIKEVIVASDARHVTLRLAELKVGYVYELHVKRLVPNDQRFFPAEAHFTLRAVGP